MRRGRSSAVAQVVVEVVRILQKCQYGLAQKVLASSYLAVALAAALDGTVAVEAVWVGIQCSAVRIHTVAAEVASAGSHSRIEAVVERRSHHMEAAATGSGMDCGGQLLNPMSGLLGYSRLLRWILLWWRIAAAVLRCWRRVPLVLIVVALSWVVRHPKADLLSTSKV